jgi:signal transduction histidine kinase
VPAALSMRAGRVSAAVTHRQDTDDQSRPGLFDPVWVLLWVLGLVAIVLFSRWAVIPLSLIWITFAVLYSFRLPQTGAAAWLATAVTVSSTAAIGLAIMRGAEPTDELAEIPMLAAMLGLLIWHGHRRIAAEAERADRNEQVAKLMAAERNLLQDASHQLKTPITIALGHAELLARGLTSESDKHDIRVVLAELGRLRRLSERMLLLAASQNTDFLLREPVALELFAAEMLRRWQPTADRQWQLGRLDQVTVHADRERIGLAVDAILENAVQHTQAGDLIRLSVLRDGAARLIIEDTGAGIAPADLSRIFERFVTGSGRTVQRGTGLGLALAIAIARGHGGDIQVRSIQGRGSTFDVVLPVQAARQGTRPPEATVPSAAGPALGPVSAPDRVPIADAVPIVDTRLAPDSGPGRAAATQDSGKLTGTAG